MAREKALVVAVANRPGTEAAAIEALAKAKVNIRSIMGWNPAGVVQIIADDAGAARQALQSAKVQFSETEAEVVELSNEPGALQTYLAQLAGQGVNLRSICAAAGAGDTKATVVWTAET